MTILIAQRFELQQKIGEGTFAEVWRATDVHGADRRAEVALKIFRPSAAGDPSRPWEPVFREIAAGLRMGPHPNVARAWALLHVRFFEGQETPCLVLDYVDGPNLALWLAPQEMPAPSNIRLRLSVMTDLLHAVAHAHARGVVHRDISFGNVLLRRSQPPRALLTDFGSSQTDEPADPATEEDETPHEIQPINPPPYKVLIPLSAGARRDVYAFGVLCYLTLTGRHPLSDDWLSMRTGQWAGTPRPHATLPRRTMTELCPWMLADPRLVALSQLLLRCVAADPTARPASAVVVRAEWDGLVADLKPESAR